MKKLKSKLKESGIEFTERRHPFWANGLDTIPVADITESMAGLINPVQLFIGDVSVVKLVVMEPDQVYELYGGGFDEPVRFKKAEEVINRLTQLDYGRSR